MLRSIAKRNGLASIPDSNYLDFQVSSPTHLPIDSNTVDVVISWSVFEHVEDFTALWSEIRRVLKPGGYIFTQIWPMFWSEHGTHLWPWLNDSFIQYRYSEKDICNQVKTSISDSDLAESVVDLFKSCNRVTVDELQISMLDAGLTLAKVELSTEAFHLDGFTQRIPLSKLGITGIKILAVSP